MLQIQRPESAREQESEGKSEREGERGGMGSARQEWKERLYVYYMSILSLYL
jgi:hypothetical protein